MNRLSVLLGMPPQDLTALLGEAAIPRPPVEVAVGIPADLLRQRPDVRRAERELAAQSEEIGIAVSDLYPHLSISGSIFVNSQSFDRLFTSGSMGGNIGPSFRWDILNYGRLRGNIRRQEARFYELLYDYQQTVLVANREAEDALATYLLSYERVEELKFGANAASEGLRIVSRRYQDGDSDFNRLSNLQVLVARQQDALAVAEGQIAQGWIDVYRALGGGWQIRLYSSGSNLWAPGELVPLPETGPNADPAQSAPLPVPAPAAQVPLSTPLVLGLPAAESVPGVILEPAPSEVESALPPALAAQPVPAPLMAQAQPIREPGPAAPLPQPLSQPDLVAAQAAPASRQPSAPEAPVAVRPSAPIATMAPTIMQQLADLGIQITQSPSGVHISDVEATTSAPTPETKPIALRLPQSLLAPVKPSPASTYASAEAQATAGPCHGPPQSQVNIELTNPSNFAPHQAANQPAATTAPSVVKNSAQANAAVQLAFPPSTLMHRSILKPAPNTDRAKPAPKLETALSNPASLAR
jgi:hypothetical protein